MIGKNLIANLPFLDQTSELTGLFLDAAVDEGWAPWYGRKHAGVGVRDGLQGAKKVGNWS